MSTDDRPTDPDSIAVHGTHHPDFAAVRREFERNFAERGELGAAVVVMVDGERVVDLWGGSVAAPREDRPAADWQPDTLVTVFSCTKAATAACLHLLADRGEVDLQTPLADIWPELLAATTPAANGPTRVHMALDHSLGLPAVRRPLGPHDCVDWDTMVAALEATEPWWTPGEANGYHMLTFGWTVGEIVRRVSGMSLGEYFRTQIAEPVGADFHIGLDRAEHHRMAKVSAWRPEPGWSSSFTEALVADREGLQAKALLNGGGFSANDPAVWEAEIGAANGTASARGLATFYRPLAANDSSLLSPESIERLARPTTISEIDRTLLVRTRFGEGFMLSMDNRDQPAGQRDSAVIGAGAFGHVGAGGSIGFADPSAGLSFAYVMNQQGPGILLNERGQSLVDATYRSLGFTPGADGSWTR
ncbi:MAG: serine hydrolase domain-containing protein [Acidimicrobiales bacterium]